jgi:hypothetical protein
MVYVVVAGLVVVLTVIGLAVHYAKRSERTHVKAKVLTEGREVEARAEERLRDRRRGVALIERLRRKRRVDQT